VSLILCSGVAYDGLGSTRAPEVAHLPLLVRAELSAPNIPEILGPRVFEVAIARRVPEVGVSAWISAPSCSR
jgi:hypothetical protein